MHVSNFIRGIDNGSQPLSQPTTVNPVNKILEKENQDLKTKIEALEADKRIVNEELRFTKDQNAMSDVERKGYISKIADLEAKVSSLTRENEDLKEQLSTRESNINSTVQQHIDAYTQLSQKFNELEKTVSQNDVKYYKDKVEELNAKLTVLSNDLMIANTNNGSLETALDAAKSENSKLREELGAKTYEADELRKHIHVEDRVVETREMYTMLQDIRKTLADSNSGDESETLLTESEASKIMEFIIKLNEKYFSDIPFSKKQFKQFVWNIPRDVYLGMIDSIERYEPEIINPMTVLYLAFCDDPGYACAHFLVTIEKMMNENRDAIQLDDDVFTEDLRLTEEAKSDTGDDDIDDDIVESETIEEDDYNG